MNEQSRSTFLGDSFPVVYFQASVLVRSRVMTSTSSWNPSSGSGPPSSTARFRKACSSPERRSTHGLDNRGVAPHLRLRDFSGIPIPFGFLISIIFLSITKGIDPSFLLPVGFTSINSVTLLSMPFFITLGYLVTGGSIARRLLDLANAIAGRIPGGLVLRDVGRIRRHLRRGGLIGYRHRDHHDPRNGKARLRQGVFGRGSSVPRRS